MKPVFPLEYGNPARVPGDREELEFGNMVAYNKLFLSLDDFVFWACQQQVTNVLDHQLGFSFLKYSEP